MPAMARVLIVGAGGLGCPVAHALAANSAIDAIELVDGDRVELANLQRQILHGTDDVGRLKVDSTRDALFRMRRDLDVVTHAERFDVWNAAGLVARADLVIDGSDNFRTKFLVNDASVLAGKPFVIAGVHRFEGQVLGVRPRATACYRCLFERPPPRRVTPNCREAGVLGSAAGLVGALEAAIALALIADPSCAPPLYSVDTLTMRFREIELARNRSCAVCGDQPTITALTEDDYRPEEDDNADYDTCADPAP